MASQGERVPGVDMCGTNLEAMVQDEIPMQDIQEQELPQLNPEPEMGAAAAVVYDTSPSLLRNPPPIPAETAHPNASDIAQLFAMMAELNRNMNAHTQTLREEMRQMGRGLQAGMKAIACSETRTTECVIATTRAGTSELGGSATAVKPAREAGEDRVIWETC